MTTTVIDISILNKWSENGLNVGTKQSERQIQHWACVIYAMKIIQLFKETTDGVKYTLHCLSSVSVLQLALFVCELRDSHYKHLAILSLYPYKPHLYLTGNTKTEVLACAKTGI